MDDNKNTNTSKKDTGQKVFIKNILDGSILTRDSVINQLPYIFFLTLIAAVYIANRYNAEKIVRQSYKVQAELKELRAESITVASKLMFVSKQSEVARLVKENGLGLEEAVEPPRKLIVEK